MGYQALLFCTDEKLAGVVSQVFSELDFAVEAVHEPFAAVKKLMAHRYDAIVVDSENEQNASLLFKSARNSSSNQSSLAIALVEGQMGVAKAYRIGANLVLTKPINVEQAKGTLRVARGLLRKNSDAALASAGSEPPPAMTARTAPAFATLGSAVQPANRVAAAMAPPSKYSEAHEFPSPLPAMSADFPEEFPETTASAEAEHKTAVPAPAAQTQTQIQTQTTIAAPSSAEERGPAAPVVIQQSSAFTSVPGSAAAPAPAKEAPAPPAKIKMNRIVESEPAHPLHEAAYDEAHDTAPIPLPTFSRGSTGDAPSFGALGEEDSGGSGGNKKILIAAAAILALAALGYLGYGKLAKPSATSLVPPPVSAPQDSGQPAPAALTLSLPVPVPAPSKTTPGRASVTTQTSVLTTANTAAPGADKSPVIRIAANSAANTAANSAPEAMKPNSAPILVKSTAAGTRTQAQPQAQAQSQTQDQESAPPLPSPQVVASANDSNVSGLISSVSSDLPKPALATLKVSQGVSQGLLIKRVTPQYPRSALAAHTEGAVQIEATINKEGNVINPKVLSGDRVLARAALEAVRQWRYKPYYLDGAPVEIQTQITVNFKAE